MSVGGSTMGGVLEMTVGVSSNGRAFSGRTADSSAESGRKAEPDFPGWLLDMRSSAPRFGCQSVCERVVGLDHRLLILSCGKLPLRHLVKRGTLNRPHTNR